MLHKALEQEKDQNYPTIRAILCEYYGNQFKDAKIAAVPEGQESYSFVAELAHGQKYFFKIEKNKIKPNETRKKRQEMICQFMAYLYDQHQLDPTSINSAKIFKANNGEFIPVLENLVKGTPSDLIGHEISLATKIAGKPFALKASIQQLNPFNWTSYPNSVIPLMANAIANFQKAGEKFCQAHPGAESVLKGEDGRTLPRKFNVVLKEVKTAESIANEELKKNLLEKIVYVHRLLNMELPQAEPLKTLPTPLDVKSLRTHIEILQEMYASILRNKGCSEFNAKTFTVSLRKFSESEQYGELLAKAGRYIHELNDCLILCCWLEDGTMKAVMNEISAFEKDYSIVTQLKRTKLAHQDTNATNFMVETTKEGKQETSLIDMFLYLSSGLRTYDLAVNLRNACPPNNNEHVDEDIAKAMVQEFDERLRLTSAEIHSLWRLFKAVEVGNALHGLAALLARAASIQHLGTLAYDESIHTQFTLESKKKVIELDSKRIAHHDMAPLVEQGRIQTLNALDLSLKKKARSSNLEDKDVLDLARHVQKTSISKKPSGK